MKKRITVKWINNGVSYQPTETVVQRCDRLGFRHKNAVIETVASGSVDGLDPSKDYGYFYDDVEMDQTYHYRIITKNNEGKAPSVPTPPFFVFDQDNEIGYPRGNPESVTTYNLITTPIFHLDANRMVKFCDKNNEHVKDLNSCIRHKAAEIDNVNITGDLICDSHDVLSVNRMIISKTDIPYRQSRVTENLKHSNIEIPLDKTDFNNGFTMFYVFYNNYTSSNQTTKFNISSNISIEWTNEEIIVNKIKTKRLNDSLWNLLCVRFYKDTLQVFENCINIYTQKNITTKFKKIQLHKLLPNHNRHINSGISEAILFNELLLSDEINTIQQYLCNKFFISGDFVTDRDLSI